MSEDLTFGILITDSLVDLLSASEIDKDEEADGDIHPIS